MWLHQDSLEVRLVQQHVNAAGKPVRRMPAILSLSSQSSIHELDREPFREPSREPDKEPSSKTDLISFFLD